MAFWGCAKLANIVFTNTEGWEADDIEISSSDLADTAKAAEYLTDTYLWSIWIRSDE